MYSLKKDGEEYYLDQDGVSWQDPESWFFCGILGGCVCGSGNLEGRAIKVLELFATPHEDRKWSVYDEPADEILAQWMDSKELLEHGTSIGGSWLTEKGEEIYKVLKSNKK